VRSKAPAWAEHSTSYRGLFRDVVIDYRGIQDGGGTGDLVFHWAHGGTSEVLYAFPPSDERGGFVTTG